MPRFMAVLMAAFGGPQKVKGRYLRTEKNRESWTDNMNKEPMLCIF